MALGKGITSSAEQITLIVTDKNGKTKKVVTAGGLRAFKTASKDMHFCPECGKQLTEIPLFLCEVCGNRYVARVEPTTGKTIIFAIGKMEELPKELPKKGYRI